MVRGLSVDILAAVLGQRGVRLYSAGNPGALSHLLFKNGALMVAAAIGLRIMLYVITASHLVSAAHLVQLGHLLKSRKGPPSPVYLMFFGGLGLCSLVWGCFQAERRLSNQRVFGLLAALGQTS